MSKTLQSSFSKELNLYQSANADHASILNNFIIRTAEFETILSDLKRKKKKDALQHELILGRRGSGKSTLLKRIQVEIDENPDFSEKYIAINLAEEQAGIYRLSDLWFEVFTELNHILDVPILIRNFSDFTDNRAYTRYLYDEVHQILKKLNKRLVLLLDNFDRILENLNDDAHLLREILHNYRDFQLIGASTRMDEHFWKYDQPFYEFFRRHHLAALSFEEIHLLLNHWSNIMCKPELKDFALLSLGKIEAVRIITDGLPRTIQFFIEILLDDNSLYGFEYIKRVMDRTTPLYQERLNNLTPPQRKIVLEMAFIWEACSTRQLVDKCRMEGKLISSYLKQLSDYGIVEVVKTGTKNHLYRIAERFFNMWIIVTQGNPVQKRRAKWLTRFLESWYDSDEIISLYSRHFEKLKSGDMSYDKATVMTKALAQSKHLTTYERDSLLESTDLLKTDLVRETSGLPLKYPDLSKRIDQLVEQKKYNVALSLTDQIDNEADGVKFFIQAYLLDLLGNHEQSIDKYKLAIQKDHVKSMYNLALLYENQGDLEKAEKYYLQAVQKDDPKAMFNLALLYKNQGDLKKAEKYYLQAVQKDLAKAMFNLALLYKNQGDLKKAEKYYLQAVQKDLGKAMFNLALLYYAGNRKQSETIALIEKYLELNDNQVGQNLYLVIKVWSGQFENIQDKIDSFLVKMAYENCNWLLQNLLYLDQTSLVLSLFQHEVHSIPLRERYGPLFYATSLLTKTGAKNLELKIPPDIMPTVRDIMQTIKEKQDFYRQESA